MQSILNIISNKSKKFIIQDNSIYTFVNPSSYYFLRKEKCLKYFDFVLIDSYYLTTLFRALGIIKNYRYSFDMTSVAPMVFEDIIHKNKTVYLIGGKDSDISLAVKNILQVFPQLHISGYRNGYFSNEIERSQVINEIVNNHIDTVIVGMGAPLQELFLNDLKNAGWKGCGLTCGGFFHQTAKRANYYPKIMNRLHLRWLYRIFDEPKLLKRYLINYPISLFYIFIDIIHYWTYPKNRTVISN